MEHPDCRQANVPRLVSGNQNISIKYLDLPQMQLNASASVGTAKSSYLYLSFSAVVSFIRVSSVDVSPVPIFF